MHRPRAVITVFFCLLSVIFLAVIFAIIEAVRFPGARAQCANASSLGLWSVFSEYENVLLEDYGLFAVDAAYGGEQISKDRLRQKFEEYTKKNEDVASELKGKLPGLLMDPWQISSTQLDVNEYALLTDRGGEYYYQQAVEYMRKTAWANALDKLKSLYQDTDSIRQAESEFDENRTSSSEDMSSLNQQANDALDELATTTETLPDGSSVEVLDMDREAELKRKQREGEKQNPLKKIADLKNSNILTLVCGDIKLSRKQLDSSTLLSKRRGNKGVLALDTPRGSGADDMLFREYQLDHFRNFTDPPGEDKILYQLEYLIGGKYKDQDNLKKVVRSLLFMREGFNYACLLSSPEKNKEASLLAAVIIGWTGKPLLVATLKQALLLAWAYGESLFDVRILMHGGRVPLAKGADSWHVPLKRLIDLKQELKRADHTSSSGLSYEDYLRLLLNLTNIKKLIKRSLDLIEINMRTVCGCPSFRADNCVIGMTVKTKWSIPSVFGRVSNALLGGGAPSTSVSIDGGFAYN